MRGILDCVIVSITACLQIVLILIFGLADFIVVWVSSCVAPETLKNTRISVQSGCFSASNILVSLLLLDSLEL